MISMIAAVEDRLNLTIIHTDGSRTGKKIKLKLVDILKE